MATQSVNLLNCIAYVLPTADKIIRLDLDNTATLKQDLADFRAGSQLLGKNFLVSYTDQQSGKQKQAWLFSCSCKYTMHVLCELFGAPPDRYEAMPVMHCLYSRDSKLLVYPTYTSYLIPDAGDDKSKELTKAIVNERANAHKKYADIIGHDRLYVCSPRLAVTEDKATIIFTTYVQDAVDDMSALLGLPFDVEESDDAMVDYLNRCGFIDQQLAGLSTYRQIVGKKPFDKQMSFFINNRTRLS